jgi:Tfp pilus assembly protein PilV
MDRLKHDESGFSMVELVIVTFVTVILMAGLSNMFVSGLRASSTASTRLSGQSNLNVALSRLEYEARCSSSAALVSSGAGVTLTIPSNCPHATGTFTWCVTSGSLIRYTSSTCSGTSQTIASDVTTARPFSCVTSVGNYPRLQIALTVNSTSSVSGNAASASEQIVLRNAALSTTSVPGCA